MKNRPKKLSSELIEKLIKPETWEETRQSGHFERDHFFNYYFGALIKTLTNPNITPHARQLTNSEGKPGGLWLCHPNDKENDENPDLKNVHAEKGTLIAPYLEGIPTGRMTLRNINIKGRGLILGDPEVEDFVSEAGSVVNFVGPSLVHSYKCRAGIHHTFGPGNIAVGTSEHAEAPGLWTQECLYQFGVVTQKPETTIHHQWLIETPTDGNGESKHNSYHGGQTLAIDSRTLNVTDKGYFHIYGWLDENSKKYPSGAKNIKSFVNMAAAWRRKGYKSSDAIHPHETIITSESKQENRRGSIVPDAKRHQHSDKGGITDMDPSLIIHGQTRFFD